MKKYKLFNGILCSITFIGIVAAAKNMNFEFVLAIAQKLGAFDFSIHPQLEKQEVNESENIKAIANLMYNIQMATNPKTRDAHAKAHGCVHAEFKIADNIDKKYQSGIFSQESKSFDAIIRFSNGSGRIQGDGVPDGRGMAVKILNAANENNKNILGTGRTQDFMMINAPRFFVGSIRDYLQFQKSIAYTKDVKSFFVERGLREALTLAGIADAETISEDQLRPILDELNSTNATQASIVNAINKVFGDQAPKIYGPLFKELADMKNKIAPLEVRIASEITSNIGSGLNETYTSMSSYLFATSQEDINSATAVIHF